MTYEGIFTTLASEVGQQKDKSSDVRRDAEAAERDGMTPRSEVLRWLSSVQDMEDEAKSIERKYNQKIKCLCSFSLNVCSTYRLRSLRNRAEATLARIRELKQSGAFTKLADNLNIMCSIKMRTPKTIGMDKVFEELQRRLLPRLRPFSTDAPGGCSVAVMQVTRSNFNAALEGLRACVEESDFVVVDLEMTGVTSAPWRNSFEFDRSDVRYLKLKDSVEKFAVVQFGVCPFRWDSSKGSFFAHPLVHNFYIFPRNELPLHGPPDDFLWQVTSIDFLAKCQFDFNACIYEVSCAVS
ncbi:hypothetical protein ZIOFF_008446 [Zingiber officinale]|uniref:Uncharacterized protein n=1 Tax=Zingiber officinale TaxID=94328 RepID=A0A8J5HSN7_ZINOF|nr:hypothetical protein ZIOFF_008446 [Zingiber officinale]